MTVKRIISEEKRANIKDLKKYKGRNLTDLSLEEKDELLELMAKKLGFL
jgi:hypothetical protein